MPLLSVNAQGPDPVACRGAGPPVLGDQLAAALGQLPGAAPLVVMIHGYRYDPGRARADPHRHILSPDPLAGRNGAMSWPHHLGLSGATVPGLGIGLGWNAGGSIWHAYEQAALAGVALARLIGMIAAIDPGRRVDILAHSLGARVAFAALPRLDPGQLGRVILMAGAEFGARAAAAAASPAGRSAEFINITTRENDLFDALLERLIQPRTQPDRSLGHGLPAPTANWLDIQIDQTRTLQGLATLGFVIAPPRRRICHWSAYQRPGLFALYRALLTRPGAIPLPLLRAHLPQTHDPRWSRLFAVPRIALPLPLLRNPSS